jgi:hypothetical protein
VAFFNGRPTPLSAPRRRCVNDPNSFLYTCDSYVIKKQKTNITPFVKHLYFAYFKIKLGDQNKK